MTVASSVMLPAPPAWISKLPAALIAPPAASVSMLPAVVTRIRLPALATLPCAASVVCVSTETVPSVATWLALIAFRVPIWMALASVTYRPPVAVPAMLAASLLTLSSRWLPLVPAPWPSDMPVVTRRSSLAVMSVSVVPLSLMLLALSETLPVVLSAPTLRVPIAT